MAVTTGAKPYNNMIRRYLPNIAQLRQIVQATNVAAAAAATADAITDNTTGTAGVTLAAGAGVYDLTFHCSLISTGAKDLVSAVVIGHKFKILSWEFVTDVPGVGSSASRVFNMEIGTTDVGTSPSTLTLTEAGTSDAGERTAGAAVSGANTGTASDTFSIEVATGGTDFSAGSGTFVVKIQNMDTADAIASQTAEYNELLTDVADIRTQLNAEIAALKTALLQASA